MARGRLHPDVALDVRLSATCSRNRYTRDPEPVITELRQIAGDRTDILAHAAGMFAGFYISDETRPLCEALLQIPGATEWVPLAEDRRDTPVHGAPMDRP